MPINFPSNPGSGQTYSYNSITWSWNGTAWEKAIGNYVNFLNGLTGGVTLAQGSNITLTPSGKTITIAASGGIGATGATGPTGPTGPQGNTGATGLVGDYVISFNGSTGAVSGVNSVNGLTGALSLLASTGVSIAAGGKGITFTNTGVQSWNGSTGSVTFNSYVSSFNGLTGAVTGVTTSVANTFTAQQNFTAGLSAAGGITLNGSLTGVTATFTRLLSANAGISSAGGTFSSLTRFTGGITASTLYVTRGATFGNLTATDIYSTNLSAVTQYTDGLYPYTGTVVAINNNGNLTTIGDYGFEGDIDFLNNGTYISVNDTTQTVRLRAPNGINTTGSFLNRVSAPSFADTYSFNETYRTTTSSTAANQTIATVEYVWENSIPENYMFYPAFEVTISARDTVLNKTEMVKMLVVQDGTNTVNTQYGLIRTGATGPVSSYTTTLSGAVVKDLLIRATPLSANSTVFTTTVRAQSGG
jgi:hypothetical protein